MVQPAFHLAPAEPSLATAEPIAVVPYPASVTSHPGGFVAPRPESGGPLLVSSRVIRTLILSLVLALTPLGVVGADEHEVDIHDIQGGGHLSPLEGDVVTVDGIVTARFNFGFWVAEPEPDADPNTSEGLFVSLAFAAAKPDVGDLVSVDGTVQEWRGGIFEMFSGGYDNLALTRLTSASWTKLGTAELPVPVVIGGGGRVPPRDVIDNDSVDGDGDGLASPEEGGVFDPAEDAIDFFESLEGMRVQVNDPYVVGPTNNFGELAVLPDGGAGAATFTERGGLLLQADDLNPERILLDDAIANEPIANVGDSLSTVVGVLDYSFGHFKLLITATPTVTPGGLQREVADAAGPQELAVATFNVENLAATDSQAKFDRLAGLIVHNLRSPDLIGIEEVQDNDGTNGEPTRNNPNDTSSIVDASLTWQRLIDAIVAAGGPVYEYRQIDPQDEQEGGVPGGNIRVGFLFHSERGLEFVDRPGGDSTTDTDVVATPDGMGAQLTLSPGRVLPDADGPWAEAFNDTRRSLAGEFRWRGETLFAVVNHFSSKGDDNPLFGRFQPYIRYSEFGYPPGLDIDGWRHAQAQVINDFVDEILAVDGDAHVIVLGDINDFDFSETVDVLTGDAIAAPIDAGPDDDGSGRVLAGDGVVLTTLFDELPLNQRYSYVFEGNSQVLDQILVSNSLLALDPVYDVVHVNSEFADQASDHEPSVMRVAFQPKGRGAGAP